MQKIIFTDLDGTLTTRDTYTQFIFRNIHLKHIIYIPRLIKIFILYFFGRLNGNDIKQETFKIFFRNQNLEELTKNLNSFIKSIQWNNKLISVIEEKRKKNYKVIIVTASPNIYIQEICDFLGYDGYISSLIELKDKQLTGNFIGEICNFDEKVNRIKKYINNNSYYTISYGNSKGDYAMLQYCTETYFIKNNEIYNYLDYLKSL